jgi:beta-lactamase regulating signal transducer with metallopeptidase domain
VNNRARSLLPAEVLAVELAGRVGLRSTPRVIALDVCTTPLVWGLGPWTTIVFPSALWESSSIAHRRAMLLHELAHLRRGDPAVRLLEATALILYWWHPVVWIARREIETAEEECCDACALAAYDSVPRNYAEALLSAIDFSAQGRVQPALGTGIRPTQQLSRRLTRIMLGAEELRLPARVRAGLLLAALAALPLYPIPSSDSSPERGVMSTDSAPRLR